MGTSQLILAGGIALAAPVLWAALGEIFCELSGTLNLGIEGVMILAAFTGATVYQRTGMSYAAVAVAAGTGLLSAAILGAIYLWLARDQIITGIMFDSAALGITAVLAQKYLTSSRVAALHPVMIPGFSDIPLFGRIFFGQNLAVYASLAAVPCVYYVIYRTWFGLHLRAVGDRPLAIESTGLSVRWVRFAALLAGCVLTAIGGVTLVLSTASTFESGLTNGRGYIALAVVAMARWNPFGAIAGAFLFGVAQTLQFQTGRIPVISHVPYDVVLMLPYLVVVMAVIFIRGIRYPAAVGVPYIPRARSDFEE